MLQFQNMLNEECNKMNWMLEVTKRNQEIILEQEDHIFKNSEQYIYYSTRSILLDPFSAPSWYIRSTAQRNLTSSDRQNYNYNHESSLELPFGWGSTKTDRCVWATVCRCKSKYAARNRTTSF